MRRVVGVREESGTRLVLTLDDGSEAAWEATAVLSETRTDPDDDQKARVTIVVQSIGEDDSRTGERLGVPLQGVPPLVLEPEQPHSKAKRRMRVL